MSDAKHTPGPWKVGGDDDDIVVMTGPFFVATIHENCNHGCTDANARLIAAAPDLLEALRASNKAAERIAEFCRKSGRDFDADHWQAIAEAGEAAIAKAEGRS